ncbi:MAG: PEP-CTERM sorting domain-containing protein [Verrucomicrobiota bacterium JB022]|nr:PEP-CTERM sorting domain-containing protein [Verrucomicrobiota bacterium JB022]
MKRTITLLALALLPALSQASVSLNFSLEWTANGTDGLGLDGSVFDFTFTTEDEVYSGANTPFGLPGALISDPFVTVSGASNQLLNGTFSVTFPEATYLSPDFFGLFYLWLYSEPYTPSFEINNGLTIASPYWNGPGVATPANGDTVELAHFEGGTVSGNTVTITHDVLGSYSYNFGSFTVSGPDAAPLVPEPSTYAALAGLGALGFIAYRRRHD